MDEFIFYQNNKQKKVKFLEKDRRNSFSDLVSNLKKTKDEKISLDVAKKTWIECLYTPIKIKKSEYYLYDMKANEGVFDEDANVNPTTLLASWFYYGQKDERLNDLSSNKSLLVGKNFYEEYNNRDLEKDYFLDTMSIFGTEYYVFRKLGDLGNDNKSFIVNLLWWIGNNVLKLDESFIIIKIYEFLSAPHNIKEDNLDYSDIEEKLGHFFPEEIKRLQSKPCCFDEIFNDIIANRLSLPKETYQFKADCYRYFMLEEGCVCYELSNNQIESFGYNQKKVRAKIYAVDSENRYEEPEKFLNKCVEVTGTLEFEKETAHFQLNVKTIEIKDEDTSLWKERMEWKEECAEILNEEILRLTKLPDITPEKKIIVISQKTSKGYADFEEKLSFEDDKSNNKLMTELTPVGRFKAEKISAAIRNASEEDNCQCICIVRGGGDPQQMHEFSHPDLLRAIYAAIDKGISVIVAIGHANDKPLCYYVKGVYGADTPTDAGNAIKNHFQGNHKETTRKKRK